MSTATDLWALQVIDLSVVAIRRRLAEIERDLGESEELAQVRAQAAGSQATLDHWRAIRKGLESEVQDLRGRLGTAEKQLMSGRVRNPKELEGMEANVAALRRREANLEDDMLQAMLEIDGTREQAEADGAELARIEGAWESRQEDLRAEQSRLQAELREQTASLQAHWSALTEDDQQLYRDLRTRKSGRAVSQIQRNTCQTCGIGLPTGLVQQVRGRETNVFCPSCGRLLYAD